MRGGAWTTSSAYQSWLAVHVIFYRDGATMFEGGAGCACSNVERYADWIWKPAWDHFRWLTQSWHTAEEPAGHYNLGPDRYCEASAFY